MMLPIRVGSPPVSLALVAQIFETRVRRALPES